MMAISNWSYPLGLETAGFSVLMAQRPTAALSLATRSGNLDFAYSPPGRFYMSATTYVSNVSKSVSTIDPAHTVAEFKVKHMMISNVKGRFSGVAGELVLEEAEVMNSRVIATLDAASINTGDPQRNAQLKSRDFLDVESFPNLSRER